eukprot:tig00021348_g20601.t1
MGLLSKGSPLPWAATKEVAEHVRRHGILQFIAAWRRLKDRHGDVLRWGEEVEYMILYLDRSQKVARLSLRAPAILERISAVQIESSSPCAKLIKWVPEYANWMLEATPGNPYGSLTSDLRAVELNMKLRRSCIQFFLEDGEHLITMPAFPRMGAPNFTYPATLPRGPVMQSLFVADAAINPHPRFPTLTRNIRERRGEKVYIHVPLFMDTNTAPLTVSEPSPLPSSSEPPAAAHGNGEPKSLTKSALTNSLNRIANGSSGDLQSAESEQSSNGADPSSSSKTFPEIYMDGMAFGMGCCCLQVTFQARDLEEARHLYDQLIPLTPIMLALTAASPMFKGLLADTDVRWHVISSSVDDRSPGERGIAPLAPGERRIKKSRYSSVDCYISNDKTLKDSYNDIEVLVDESSYNTLLEAGVDERLARHIAHLFIRDPLVVYKELLEQDDEESTDHFENIQSTNWNTVRFKPPPPGTEIGWRVEFRSMEVQLTDFENAAFVVFTVLLSRIILYFDLNFYIPISKVDENMEKAHIRGAVNTEKFWFRKHISKACCALTEGMLASPEHDSDECDKYDLFTINEIFNGKGDKFPGLIPLVSRYLDSIECDDDTREVVDQYLELIRLRASGKLVTAATYMRDYVHKHPAYKQDSVVSEEITYDLMRHLTKLAAGEVQAPELLQDFIQEATAKPESEPSSSQKSRFTLSECGCAQRSGSAAAASSSCT